MDGQAAVTERPLGVNQAFPRVFSRAGNDHEGYPDINYYGLPAIKQSDYRWLIAGSFFSEGIAGAGQLLSTIINLTGDGQNRALVRTARYSALAGSLTASALFVYTLGTPSRFLNMLRIFRPTSVMSIGVWNLGLFSALSGAVAAGQVLEDLGYPRAGGVLSKTFQVPAAATGSMVSLYMGTELEATSTPLWANSYPLLPTLFALEDAADAIAVMEIASELSGTSPVIRKRLARLAVVAGVSRLFLAWQAGRRVFHERQVAGKESTALELLYGIGVLGLSFVAPLLVRISQLIFPAQLKPASLAAAGATLVGGFVLPAIILLEGNASARNPKDYFDYTRPEARTEENILSDDRMRGFVPARHISKRRRKRVIKWAIAIAGASLALLVITSGKGIHYESAR